MIIIIYLYQVNLNSILYGKNFFTYTIYYRNDNI